MGLGFELKGFMIAKQALYCLFIFVEFLAYGRDVLPCFSI
jgi:hypothetical protein